MKYAHIYLAGIFINTSASVICLFSDLIFPSIAAGILAMFWAIGMCQNINRMEQVKT